MFKTHRFSLLSPFQLTELELTASSKEDLDAKMTTIDGQLHILRKALTFVCKHTACKLNDFSLFTQSTERF